MPALHPSQPDTSARSVVNLTEAEEARYAELQRQALDFARHGETATLRLMVESGLPVNLCDHKGQSLLMLASYNGHLDTTQMLLSLGAEVDRRNDRGQTPLGGVAFKGYRELAELLVSHGADIEADNGGGMTPLSFAALFGRRDVVAFLKSQGAKLRMRDHFLGIGGSLLKRIVM
ncbi:ankyrin repeat domain-containing protein [Ruficoccus amylovorans]|uniref:Ankyrin repeat domain-containing protein n=1 Tax=Ruficoccus amylovorans TaxID=1804625 RepID=A0A842HDB1_9BACT|nr:ankyrin repeat domain-containing protein [Ruficoccus amylovorans]MBC2593351.1 ankyrin repeat domain-containing protein [Ruficoccus amylovorans]